MAYQTVYKVYKDYHCRLGVHRHLVGYFKSESLACKEINYLRCHELEIGHHVEFRVETEPATLYPDLVALWEKQDREEELERQRMLAPIPLPRIRKRWPALFADLKMDEELETFHQKTANNMMSFVRSLSRKHRRRS
jgi:hypothetical protein